MKPLVDEKTAQEVAKEAQQIVAEAIKDAEQMTGMTHKEFLDSMEKQRVKPTKPSIVHLRECENFDQKQSMISRIFNLIYR